MFDAFCCRGAASTLLPRQPTMAVFALPSALVSHLLRPCVTSLVALAPIINPVFRAAVQQFQTTAGRGLIACAVSDIKQGIRKFHGVRVQLASSIVTGRTNVSR
mmetsp:Transcript_10073/g.16864  ORF Transcript_10073/g.16864 Transcript_10073/m.16864 type:complete len:104 (+) Transcript_10073:166-477(+)